MPATIRLPIINFLKVENYSLYPGAGKNGLTIDFEDGVTVIAGINGIGKTTLLTLLLRLLLGPYDPKATSGLGKASQRKLTPIKKFDFFRTRVPEILDINSYAVLSITIGEVKVEISRFMRDMSLRSVEVNGEANEGATDNSLLSFLSETAGFQSVFDFHLVVRYLQFFNEERLPLLWEPSAQFEFFKILFFERSIAQALNENFAKIQSIDTNYRNRKHQLNKRRDSLPPLENNSAEIEAETLNVLIEDARCEFNVADSTFKTAKDKYDETNQEIRSSQAQLDIALSELLKLEQQAGYNDALFILQNLPSLKDKEKFLLQGFASNCGCFVCGNRSPKQISRIREKTLEKICFACDTPIKNLKSPTSSNITAEELNNIEEVIAQTASYVDSMEAKIQEQNEILTSLTENLQIAASSRAEKLRNLDSYLAQRPRKEPTDILSIRDLIRQEESELELLAIDRDYYTEEFRRTVTKAQDQMELMRTQLTDHLTSYASAFLQESVNVNFVRQTPFKIATGAERVNIPTFTIQMTSSTHKVAHERLHSNSVSESQKEFLDLAFRMTLLDIISNSGPTMLIVETPEASLDSWFMLRAASLMRKFAPDAGNRQRKILATSNVNGTVMIPALLGIIDENGTITKLKKAKSKHLINLLEMTPAPATLNRADSLAVIQEEIGKYINDK